MMNIRSRWALVIGLTLATISTTMLLSNNVPVVVKDGNGVSQTFMVVQNAAGGLVAENAICDGQAAAACATVKGSSSAAAATDSAMVVALTPNSPAVTSAQAASLVPMPIYAGTLTTSPASGASLNPPVAIGSSITLTESPSAGSNFVAPVAIGSAPTLTTSPVAGVNNVNVNGFSTTATVITSAAQASAVQNINCISGCAGAGTTVTSAANTTLVQTGYPADAVCGSDTGTCSEIALIKRLNQIVDGPLAAGTNNIGIVGLTASTTGGCTSAVVTASTTAIFTQIKSSAGTLCWLRIINASTITASVRLFDTAINGNFVCSSLGNPLSMDVAQPNTVSPGLVANLGTFGQTFASGIGLCLSTGGASGVSTTDTTSLTTNAMVINIGFK